MFRLLLLGAGRGSGPSCWVVWGCVCFSVLRNVGLARPAVVCVVAGEEGESLEGETRTVYLTVCTPGFPGKRRDHLPASMRETDYTTIPLLLVVGLWIMSNAI